MRVCSLPLLRVNGEGSLCYVRGAAEVRLRELGICLSVFGGDGDWCQMDT